MIERAHGLNCGFVTSATLDGNGALACGGKEFARIQDQGMQRLLRDVDAAEIRIEQAEPQQPGGGEQHGIERVFSQDLLHSRGHVAADLDDLDIRPQKLELRGPADAASANTGALRQGFKREGLRGDEHVFDRGTGQHGGDGESCGEITRHVLEAVDGGIDLAVCEGDFEFLDEDAFVHVRHVVELREAQILAFVAAGLNDLPLDVKMRMGGLQLRSDHFCLREGQFAAASAKDDFFDAHETRRPVWEAPGGLR